MVVYTLDAPTTNLQLEGGYYFRFEAISPTTGAAITGVTVSDIAIYGIDLSEAADESTLLGPFMLVSEPEGG